MEAIEWKDHGLDTEYIDSDSVGYLLVLGLWIHNIFM